VKTKHQITIEFGIGEKCFCCNEHFDKNTKIVRNFDTREEAKEFQDMCEDILQVINESKQLSEITKNKLTYNKLYG
jgi:hypothetical protein